LKKNYSIGVFYTFQGKLRADQNF